MRGYPLVGGLMPQQQEQPVMAPAGGMAPIDPRVQDSAASWMAGVGGPQRPASFRNLLGQATPQLSGLLGGLGAAIAGKDSNLAAEVAMAGVDRLRDQMFQEQQRQLAIKEAALQSRLKAVQLYQAAGGSSKKVQELLQPLLGEMYPGAHFGPVEVMTISENPEISAMLLTPLNQITPQMLQSFTTFLEEHPELPKDNFTLQLAMQKAERYGALKDEDAAGIPRERAIQQLTAANPGLSKDIIEGLLPEGEMIPKDMFSWASQNAPRPAQPKERLPGPMADLYAASLGRTLGYDEEQTRQLSNQLMSVPAEEAQKFVDDMRLLNAKNEDSDAFMANFDPSKPHTASELADYRIKVSQYFGKNMKALDDAIDSMDEGSPAKAQLEMAREALAANMADALDRATQVENSNVEDRAGAMLDLIEQEDDYRVLLGDRASIQELKGVRSEGSILSPEGARELLSKQDQPTDSKSKAYVIALALMKEPAIVGTAMQASDDKERKTRLQEAWKRAYEIASNVVNSRSQAQEKLGIAPRPKLGPEPPPLESIYPSVFMQLMGKVGDAWRGGPVGVMAPKTWEDMASAARHAAVAESTKQANSPSAPIVMTKPPPFGR